MASGSRSFSCAEMVCTASGCISKAEEGKDKCFVHRYPAPADPAVAHPAHYNTGSIECIDAITEAVKGLRGIEAVCIGNAIKYLWRHDVKGGTQDLEKAKWYIDRCISERKERGAK